MRIFLAGNTIFPVYIAPTLFGGGFSREITQHRPYILESFFYADADTERLIPYFGDFLLDSGAFTFMMNSKIKVDWMEYAERYANFINKNNIEKFFELDIDSVIGYGEVLKLRKRLESMTGRQSIPVWHSTRGVDEFKKMCDEYPYVALGGIVGNEWSAKAEKAIPWFIQEAHKRNAKIHGLGYTKLSMLPKFHFDSVDSTAWTTGNRFGYIYKFQEGKMLKIDVPKGKRIGDSKKAALINYIEWIKLQRWALTNL